MEHFKGPALTVDAVIEFPDNRVVLIRRGHPPFEGRWALPGGFVEIGETVDSACRREMKEECNVDVELRGIIGVYDTPGRDPRGQTVSIVFRAGVLSGSLEGRDDAIEARLFERNELPELDLAFDHAKILRDAGWLR